MVGAGLAGSSGAAAAAPRLGYVLGCGPTDEMDELTRSQALADQKLYREAVKAAAIAWKGGMLLSLPVPPRGVQWNIGGSTGCKEEMERSCKLTATLDDKKGTWSFSIGGKFVAPLDARNVLSCCFLPSTIKPLALSTDPVSMRLTSLLRRVFYAHSTSIDPSSDNFAADGGKVGMEELGLNSRLELFELLHSIAIDSRCGGVDGFCVGWVGGASSKRDTSQQSMA